MKEYCIYIRHGSSMPYTLSPYSDIFSAKKAVQSIVDFEEERRRLYFVDNDYFPNKYAYAGNVKYLRIQVREVAEWQTYSEFSNFKTDNQNKNNIIIFDNFKKST